MNWFQVLQWESAPLAELARDAESKSRELQAAGEELNAQLNSLTGSGKTVTAVQQAISKRISEIDKQVNYLISVGEIEQLLTSWPIHVDTSGVVSFVGSIVDSVQSLVTHPQEMVKTIGDRIGKVLGKATALEVKLVAMMAALGLGIFDNRVNYSASGASKPSLPPAVASEQEVASWWSQQSDANKKWLIENYPEKIGNLNGVDATSRDKANRIVLDQKLNDLPGQIDKLDEEAANAPLPGIRNAVLGK